MTHTPHQAEKARLAIREAVLAYIAKSPDYAKAAPVYEAQISMTMIELSLQLLRQAVNLTLAQGDQAATQGILEHYQRTLDELKAEASND